MRHRPALPPTCMCASTCTLYFLARVPSTAHLSLIDRDARAPPPATSRAAQAANTVINLPAFVNLHYATLQCHRVTRKGFTVCFLSVRRGFGAVAPAAALAAAAVVPPVLSACWAATACPAHSSYSPGVPRESEAATALNFRAGLWPGQARAVLSDAKHAVEFESACCYLFYLLSSLRSLECR
jgi:hypothetical protein